MSPGRHAVQPRYSPENWLVFGVIGCCVAAVTTIVVPDWLWAPGVVQAAGIGAAIVGVLRNRPTNTYAWWLMLAGGSAWTVADALIRGDAAAGLEAPPRAAILLVVSYATVALGLVLLTRRPGGRPANTADAIVIGAALLVAVWTFAVRPMTAATWPLPGDTAIALGHATAAAVLVFAVLRFAALDSHPSGASALLPAAALA
ncbi:MAG: hypothetical protein HKP61_15805, partial [Dactylosporangium sp.]|nr:hypothetical protein [Dactylosporangium sp.]NNJ62370.1 hypothetical protein [Dactylosporangium sp.]